MQRQYLLSRDDTQWMQGLSILGIMLMHYVMQTGQYPRVLNIVGSVGVAVFLFVSGFGINESYKLNGLKGFWRKRLLRVALPCWVVFIFRLPFADGFDPRAQLLNFLFIDSDLWFIDFIVRWYIVYWLVRRFAPRHATAALAGFGFTCIFLEQLMAEQAFSFFAGYMASRHYDKVKRWSRAKAAKTAAAAVAYGVLFAIVKSLPPVRPYVGTLPFNIILLNIKLPLAAALIAAPYVAPWVKRLRFVNWLGRISYELYIVHFNFMPYVTGYASVAAFSAFSMAVSEVFNRVNARLKDNRQITGALAALLFTAVCYTLACKYAMRATDSFGPLCITYAAALGAVYLLISGGKASAPSDPRRARVLFWLSLAALAALQLAVQYHFDPMQNRVDRWSAIANPLTALFAGEFPYLAETHLGGNASPFPVWMAFHIPFWALGNVGLSEIFTTALFVYSVKARGGHTAGTKAALLLGLSANLWYETAVRSDLISNFLLLAAFVNMLSCKGVTFGGRPYLLSAAAGLWLSTRLSTAFPLFILFFPYWLKLPAKKKAATVAAVVAVFCLTFLPLAVWDSDSLFFAENNPFSLQSRQGHPSDTLLLAAAAVAFALSWRGDYGRLMLSSAVMLVLTPLTAYVHSMYAYGNWTEFFSSAYDITYFDAALPFCASLLATLNGAAGRPGSPACKA